MKIGIKHLFFITLTLCFSVFAQEQIYRCGNIYTNEISMYVPGYCKSLDGGKTQIMQIQQANPMQSARYQKCLNEASKSPSDQGVRIAVLVCKAKFENEQERK